MDGRRLTHGLVSKVEKWRSCSSVSEVRGFLGTVGVVQNWICGFAKIAKPLTQLLRISQFDFKWSADARGDHEYCQYPRITRTLEYEL